MDEAAPIPAPAVPPVFHFPLTLAIATILTTGLALAAAALNLQWGAAAPTPDALQNSWLYVNLALLCTTLAIYPPLVLSRTHPLPSRTHLLCHLPTLFTAAIPALALAAFLSNIPPIAITATLALQLAAATLATGLISWHPRIPAIFITAALTSLAIILPILAYLTTEFLPTAPQSCLSLIPTLALHQAATAFPTAFFYWTISLYAFLGLSLLATAPRHRPT